MRFIFCFANLHGKNKNQLVSRYNEIFLETVISWEPICIVKLSVKGEMSGFKSDVLNKTDLRVGILKSFTQLN